MARVWVGILCFSLILMPTFLGQGSLTNQEFEDLDRNLTTLTKSTEELTPHGSIYIFDDNDLIQQGWPGDGSPENPYLIENLRIDGYLSLKNVSKHIVVRNCSMGEVQLQNSVNIIIANCVISGYDFSIQVQESDSITISGNTIYRYDPFYGLGILLEESTNCILDGNFITGWDKGTVLQSCTRTTIANNTYAINNHGISLINSHENLVRSNTVTRSGNLGVCLYTCSNNSIYNNRLSMNEYNALDSYGQNTWDDNSSLGNGWDDYNDTGVYHIPSNNNAVDRYPWKLTDFSYTFIDNVGPFIYFADPASTTRTMVLQERVDYLDFGVRVTDWTDVDTVLLCYRFSTHDSYTRSQMFLSNWGHDVYSLQINTSNPYDGEIWFHYWANDTLGNTRTTYDLWDWWYGYGSPSSTTTDSIVPVEMSIFLIGAAFGIVIVIIYAQRTVCNKGTIPSST